MPLFHPRVIEKHIKHIEPISDKHADILGAWAENLSNGIYDSETQNDDVFIQRILVDVLGYVRSSDGQNWTVAKNQPVGKGNVDAALGEFSADETKIIVPFELKGAKTKDLDAVMAGRNKTPVQQAWEYAMDAKGAQWVCVSNYREIRLYAVGYGRKDYEVFDLSKLTEPQEYARFILLLSSDNLLGGKTQSLLKESEQVDKDITDQLYADYKALRAKLIETLKSDNPDKDPLEIIRFTQTILDRILFIAFAEDKGLLPENTLKKAYETKNLYSPQPVWENFKGLFQAINKGNPDLKIPAYNGGLFKDTADLNNLNISDALCEGFKKIGDYDFDSDVSVNILGHIFEQSISDLEELKAHAENVEEINKKQSKRKKDGIFYTPPYITRYIVEQAVGGWLNDRKIELGIENLPEISDEEFDIHRIDIKSKRFTQKVTQEFKTKRQQVAKKVNRHIEFWESYKKVISNIKVLDPACGSGAFLNEVFDYLKTEGEAVNGELANLKNEQISLFRWDTHILANNIYGVDLNSESVEITKLSLWLKTANRQEKLTYLEDNIKVGNSLIDDAEIAESLAFNWDEAFSEIMQNGGFDVIVGNPPYGADLTEKQQTYLGKNYESFEYQANTYVLFYEKGIKLLKNRGVLGYITPATFTYQHYFQKIRALFSKLKIRNIAKYNFAVFDDADIGDTVSLIVENSKADKSPILTLVSKNKEEAVSEHTTITKEKLIASDGTYRLANGEIPERLYKNPKLGDIANVVVGVKPYQTGKGKPKQTKDIVKQKPFTAYEKIDDSYKECVVGSNFHRYRFIEKPMMRLKYGNWLAEPRPDAPFFDNEKIIIRQTADSIIANLDTSKAVNLNNVYNIGQKDAGYSLKYLLGILNSSLVNKIYQDISQEKGKLFAEVKKVYLNKIPIKKLSSDKQKPLVNLVDNILQNNKKLFETSNNLLSLLQNEFPVEKISKKLLNWFDLDFSDFIAELEKSIKPAKLSLSQKSEWMEHFEKEKSKAVELKNKIRQTDCKIDQMVYELYELTPEEVELIEGGQHD